MIYVASYNFRTLNWEDERILPILSQITFNISFGKAFFCQIFYS